MRQWFSAGIVGVVVLFGLSAVPAFPQTGAKTPAIKRVPAAQTDPSSGAEMYKSYCAACHGTEGKGNGPAAKALTKAPADLTILAKGNSGKFPQKQFEDTVTNAALAAHGSSDMPIWGPIFRQLHGGDEGAKLRVFNLMKYVEDIQTK